MHVFWHRRDLRLSDNRGLARASADDSVLPVVVVDPDRADTAHRAFRMAGIRALKQRYRERGGDLLIRTGQPADVLATLVSAFDAERVYYNRHYAPERRKRARAVDERVPTTTATDLVLVDPADLDERYENHGHFRDDWMDAPKQEPAEAPDPDTLVDVEDDTEPPDVETAIDLPEAGYRAARKRYDRFLSDGIETYADTRDDMDAAVARPVGAVSRLSPYLAAGMIGIREVWAETNQRYEAASGDTERNVWKFRDELSWREGNYHLLYYNQGLPTENYDPFPEEMAWENDADHVEAWTRGETGYPLVDAGMRQLNGEGYVHNRPRQNVASFLTKHLLVDWRVGEQYFAEHLLDYDPANNAGNWQWIAGTGTDSVDVRIFDPVAQMAKYDADATYVRAYVPELRDVPAEKIVEWPNLTDTERKRLAPAYPHPIVDRNGAYERAQRVFERALGKRT